VLVSRDGRFVYAGNRLHDSIGIFAVGAGGALSYVDEVWTRGDYPRSFGFDPDGRFLYCCNQRGDNVTVFRVDRDRGGLEFTGAYAAVGNPSHVVTLCGRGEGGTARGRRATTSRPSRIRRPSAPTGAARPRARFRG
jgi:6-phosphogluconolactonase (cycloisomerase 2 family)